MLDNSSYMSSRSTVYFNYCFFLQAQEMSTSVQGIPALLIGLISALCSLVAMTGNSVILVSIWRNSSLRTPSYILLAGLAATDFTTGLITQPLYAVYMLMKFSDENVGPCAMTTTFHTSDRYFAAVTIGTITVMSIARWLHVSRRSLITVRRAYVIYGMLLVLQPY